MPEDKNRLAGLIDHTLIGPLVTLDALAAACADARRWRFAALVVNSWQVARATAALADSGVKVSSVVGFPHGASTTTVKIVEAMEAVKNGAEELEIVMNLGMLKSGRPDLAEIDVKNVVVMTKGVIHKIIIETGSLTPEELKAACGIVVRSGAEFVKTSTGFGNRGVSTDDVHAIRAHVGSTCKIKASGGIRDLAAFRLLLDAGADRIGTSAGPALMEELS